MRVFYFNLVIPQCASDIIRIRVLGIIVTTATLAPISAMPMIQTVFV